MKGLILLVLFEGEGPVVGVPNQCEERWSCLPEPIGAGSLPHGISQSLGEHKIPVGSPRWPPIPVRPQIFDPAVIVPRVAARLGSLASLKPAEVGFRVDYVRTIDITRGQHSKDNAVDLSSPQDFHDIRTALEGPS